MDVTYGAYVAAENNTLQNTNTSNSKIKRAGTACAPEAPEPSFRFIKCISKARTRQRAWGN